MYHNYMLLHHLYRGLFLMRNILLYNLSTLMLTLLDHQEQ